MYMKRDALPYPTPALALNNLALLLKDGSWRPNR
jgi:hypothetical protein